MAKLYKYLNSDIAGRLRLEGNSFGVKLSSLEEYNDPFESFLTIDFDQSPEILAYYSDVIKMNRSSLVSCFSKRPDSTPMWAHYANNMAGFVLEIDEDRLREYLNDRCLENYQIEDIKYMSEAGPDVENSLRRALATRKPRHLHWLNKNIQYALYFYKQSCWEYENERRVIMNPRHAISVGSIYLLSVAFECIDSIIIGKNIAAEARDVLHKLSIEFGLDFYEMQIGKTQAVPYFVNNNKQSFLFNGSELVMTESCLSCGEPTENDDSMCFWCLISEDDRDNAAQANTFRMLHSMGRLESVLEGYHQIDRRHNRK